MKFKKIILFFIFVTIIIIFAFGQDSNSNILTLSELQELVNQQSMTTNNNSQDVFEYTFKDISKLIIGGLFFIVYTLFLFYFYKTNFTTYKITQKNNGLKFWLSKEYHIVEPNNINEQFYNFSKFLVFIYFFIGIGITCLIVF